MRPKLLDLFCRAGGAGMGYHQAGFEVTGVDHVPQKRYPFCCIQADALEYCALYGDAYDIIHASPPCQRFSVLKHMATKDYEDLIEPTRAALQATRKPWVIENVVGAPLRWPLLLCGTMFGLQTSCGAQLRRHRLFESSALLLSPGGPCSHRCMVQDTAWGACSERRKYGRIISITGSTPQQSAAHGWPRETFSVVEARVAMGIDWMGMKDLSQAVPPAYTAFIGKQLRSMYFPD